MTDALSRAKDHSAIANDHAFAKGEQDDIWSTIASEIHSPIVAVSTKEGSKAVVALAGRANSDFDAADVDHDGYVGQLEIEHYATKALDGRGSIQVAQFLHDNYDSICTMHKDAVYSQNDRHLAIEDKHGITKEDLRYILELKDPAKGADVIASNEVKYWLPVNALGSFLGSIMALEGSLAFATTAAGVIAPPIAFFGGSVAAVAMLHSHFAHKRLHEKDKQLSEMQVQSQLQFNQGVIY